MTSKDVKAVMQCFDEEPVLFGSASVAVGVHEVRAYLSKVLDGEELLRWEWRHVMPLVETSLAFAVTGTVGFDEADGSTVEERDPFRLTCVASNQDGRWLQRHFHGSIPPS